mmetsp:Transcript_3422/g.5220  ORF Transcript_3422/g.5220 Transcript_3422/m.5220 type:complete len:146 (+) Transcript_3422:137-574(+)
MNRLGPASISLKTTEMYLLSPLSQTKSSSTGCPRRKHRTRSGAGSQSSRGEPGAHSTTETRGRKSWKPSINAATCATTGHGPPMSGFMPKPIPMPMPMPMPMPIPLPSMREMHPVKAVKHMHHTRLSFPQRFQARMPTTKLKMLS